MYASQPIAQEQVSTCYQICTSVYFQTGFFGAVYLKIYMYTRVTWYDIRATTQSRSTPVDLGTCKRNYFNEFLVTKRFFAGILKKCWLTKPITPIFWKKSWFPKLITLILRVVTILFPQRIQASFHTWGYPMFESCLGDILKINKSFEGGYYTFCWILTMSW